MPKMLGFGWCHLRSSREPYRNASFEEVFSIDEAVNKADRILWAGFREWMSKNSEPFIQWQFHEALNNHDGLLTFCVSRNHRSSSVWEMWRWIADNGPGSYGLFYCHDDEDTHVRMMNGRQTPMDCDNVFRVHRLLHGEILELCDPFFGMIEGNIDPVHPYHLADEADNDGGLGRTDGT